MAIVYYLINCDQATNVKLNRLKVALTFVIVVASCCPILAESPHEPGSRGSSVLIHDQNQAHSASHPSTRSLSSVSGCSSPTWLCSVSPDLQHWVSDTLYSAIKSGQCLRVSATLGLWRCGSSLVPDDVQQMVTNGTCTSECTTQAQICAAFAPSPAFVPAPAPSTQLSVHIFINLELPDSPYRQGCPSFHLIMGIYVRRCPLLLAFCRHHAHSDLQPVAFHDHPRHAAISACRRAGSITSCN